MEAPREGRRDQCYPKHSHLQLLAQLLLAYTKLIEAALCCYSFDHFACHLTFIRSGNLSFVRPCRRNCLVWKSSPGISYGPGNLPSALYSVVSTRCSGKSPATTPL